MPAELIPFGFTATESLVYSTLLRLGPATGYAVARAVRLARANAYGALDGLVSRGAATHQTGRGPGCLPPADAARSTEPETKTLAGARAVANVVLQLVARAERRVEGVLAAELWRATLPAWRRAAARAQVELRIAGDAPTEA